MRTQALHSHEVAWRDVAAAPTEPEIAALDGVEEHRAIDSLGRHVGEGRVTLQLGQPEVRPEGADDGSDEVGQDVLGMVQLDVGQVAGVAGDVGDQEAGGLRGREHRAQSRGEARRGQSLVSSLPADAGVECAAW